MDIDKLLNALDKEKNEKIADLTTKKLYQINFDVLKELHLSPTKNTVMLNKLRYYVYVDELNDFREGTYIRWINLTNPSYIELSKGSIFCETKITDNGVYLSCKNLFNCYFQIKMDECLVFRKLTEFEILIIKSLDLLEAKKTFKH